MERSAWCDTTTSRRATGRTAASGQFAGIRRRERERAKARRRSLRRSLHLLDFLGMPTIQIKKTGEEPGAASLAVTVPVEQVQEAEARATTAYQRRARLPGFRKGKAPAALVKRQFADDILQHTLERTGKFHLKRTVPKVTEDRVLAQLNELRAPKAPSPPVAPDKPPPHA